MTHHLISRHRIRHHLYLLPISITYHRLSGAVYGGYCGSSSSSSCPLHRVYIETLELHSQSSRSLNSPTLQRLHIFLASDLAYAKPVDDPIFSAHGDPAAIYGGPVLYLTDNDPPVSVLGCAEQHQFCKLDGSGKPTCVPPTGLDGATASDVELALTPRQGAIFRRIYDCVSENILSAVIAQLGANSLLATLSVGGGVSVGLPPNQWQLEIENWLAIMMSNIQLETVQYATGPSDPQFLKHVNTTAGGFGSTSDGTWMCDNQIMQDNSYICFSVLGLVLILCIGGLFSIVGLVIDDIVGFVQKYTGRSNYRLLEWIADETLQLQRSAYQANGLGTWSSTTDSVPITALGDRFGLPSKKADLKT